MSTTMGLNQSQTITFSDATVEVLDGYTFASEFVFWESATDVYLITSDDVTDGGALPGTETKIPIAAADMPLAVNVEPYGQLAVSADGGTGDLVLEARS